MLFYNELQTHRWLLIAVKYYRVLTVWMVFSTHL